MLLKDAMNPWGEVCASTIKVATIPSTVNIMKNKLIFATIRTDKRAMPAHMMIKSVPTMNAALGVRRRVAKLVNCVFCVSIPYTPKKDGKVVWAMYTRSVPIPTIAKIPTTQLCINPREGERDLLVYT